MVDCSVPYVGSSKFSALINEFLQLSPAMASIYPYLHQPEDYASILQAKTNFFTKEKRLLLHQSLLKQYKNFEIAVPLQSQLNELLNEHTFTITTGHQLNLFTGPLYFFYKIADTIILCKKLKEKYPQYHFVPVYWMATEDHDWEEINHFYLGDQKIVWDANTQGAVGHLSTKGMEKVADILTQVFGKCNRAKELIALFEKAYLQHTTLKDATRALVMEFFGEDGLVIVDGDDQALKQSFVPWMQREINESITWKTVHEQTKYFEVQNWKVQVNPREVNLFYFHENQRLRIEKHSNDFKLVGTTLQFTLQELLQELQNQPEKFSPNVLLRPLYQEVVLPNLCYVGGGGELAYWLQLTQLFIEMKVPFPILQLRDSVVVVDNKWWEKMQKMQLQPSDLFLNKEVLANQKVKEWSQNPLDFTNLKQQLEAQFAFLENHIHQTHASFEGAVKAQKQKQIKGLQNLEKRYWKAEKKKQTDALQRLYALHEAWFPGGQLQERKENFSGLYLAYGKEWLPKIMASLDPWNASFKIVVLD